MLDSAMSLIQGTSKTTCPSSVNMMLNNCVFLPAVRKQNAIFFTSYSQSLGRLFWRFPVLTTRLQSPTCSFRSSLNWILLHWTKLIKIHRTYTDIANTQILQLTAAYKDHVLTFPTQYSLPAIIHDRCRSKGLAPSISGLYGLRIISSILPSSLLLPLSLCSWFLPSFSNGGTLFARSSLRDGGT